MAEADSGTRTSTSAPYHPEGQIKRRFVIVQSCCSIDAYKQTDRQKQVTTRELGAGLVIPSKMAESNIGYYSNIIDSDRIRR